MVTGLFCFDGPLYKDKNGTYCNITLTNEMFDRYFYVVDRLIVAVRTYQENKSYKELNMKQLVLGTKIQVIEIENLNTIYGLFVGRRRLTKNLIPVVRSVDLIFARMPSTTSDVVLDVARKMNKPYLVEVGGCAWDAFWNHGLKGKVVAPYMFLKERQGIRKAAFATYVTKKFLQERYPNNNETISSSNVYLAPVNDAVLDERIKKICRGSNQIIFGQAVNSIDVKYKGEHLIIKALRRLKNLGIRAEFQVVGPGNGEYLKKVALKNNVSDQLKLIGTLKKEEIAKWYQSIDVYVQPSKQEGLPRAVIEAMSMGCPCAGSNIAGIPELIDSDYLFNPDRESEIITVLLKIIDKENMKQQARINFYKAKEYYINKISVLREEIFRKYHDSVSYKY